MAPVRPRFLDRFSNRRDEPEPTLETAGTPPTVVQIDATSLSRVFSAPM